MTLNAYALELPQLSGPLTDKLYAVADSYNFQEGWDPVTLCSSTDYNSWVSYHTITGTLGCAYKAFDIPLDLQNEIRQEMTDNLFPFSKMEFYFQIVYGGNTLCPHVDAGRTLNLLYNISADGATTRFHDKLIHDSKRYIFSADEVSAPIETHQFEPYQWYVFNNQKVHSVVNIDKKRIAIAANIPHTFEVFYNYYKGVLIGRE